MPKKLATAPKTTAVKKVIKKAAPKKSVVTTKKKAGGKKALLIANNQQSFWVNNGPILNSLLALEAALNDMTKETFSYHVSKDRNDFAQWVEYVLVDVSCAADLRKAKTASVAKTAVTKHLKTYEL